MGRIGMLGFCSLGSRDTAWVAAEHYTSVCWKLVSLRTATSSPQTLHTRNNTKSNTGAFLCSIISQFSFSILLQWWISTTIRFFFFPCFTLRDIISSWMLFGSSGLSRWYLSSWGRSFCLIICVVSAGVDYVGDFVPVRIKKEIRRENNQ